MHPTYKSVGVFTLLTLFSITLVSQQSDSARYLMRSEFVYESGERKKFVDYDVIIQADTNAQLTLLIEWTMVDVQGHMQGLYPYVFDQLMGHQVNIHVDLARPEMTITNMDELISKLDTTVSVGPMPIYYAYLDKYARDVYVADVILEQSLILYPLFVNFTDNTEIRLSTDCPGQHIRYQVFTNNIQKEEEKSVIEVEFKAEMTSLYDLVDCRMDLEKTSMKWHWESTVLRAETGYEDLPLGDQREQSKRDYVDAKRKEADFQLRKIQELIEIRRNEIKTALGVKSIRIKSTFDDQHFPRNIFIERDNIISPLFAFRPYRLVIEADRID